MKILFHLVAAVFWFATSADAETLDRIVAIVDNRIVTLSDVRQENAIRAALGEKAIPDDEAVQQLIEAVLIEGQLADFPGIDLDDAQIADMTSKVTKKDGITDAALRNAVLRRFRAARYFDLRFRQFLRATDEEIRTYYDSVFIPELKARGVNPVPPLEQVSEAIRTNVIEEKLDREVTVWLDALRRRSNIEILK
jgi:parvulin-like peptidyl-prolyl isomerase